MSTTRAFQRNAREFANYLSQLLTQTVTRQPLACDFVEGGNQALIRFRNGYADLGNTGSIRVLQRIGPNLEQRRKVTTFAYSYAFILGPDPDKEPFVRYEYVPELAAQGDFPYPVGHVHLSAVAPDYEELIAHHEPKSKPLHQVHFPAGPITLADFIRLLIIEFYVPTHDNDPQKALKRLDESREVFHETKKARD